MDYNILKCSVGIENVFDIEIHHPAKRFTILELENLLIHVSEQQKTRQLTVWYL